MAKERVRIENGRYASVDIDPDYMVNYALLEQDGVDGTPLLSQQLDDYPFLRGSLVKATVSRFGTDVFHGIHIELPKTNGIVEIGYEDEQISVHGNVSSLAQYSGLLKHVVRESKKLPVGDKTIFENLLEKVLLGDYEASSSLEE